jgi:hypothetical protein
MTIPDPLADRNANQPIVFVLTEVEALAIVVVVRKAIYAGIIPGDLVGLDRDIKSAVGKIEKKMGIE